MPNWKKVIVSGSDASLNTLSVDNNTHLSGSLNVFKSGSTVFTIEGSQGTLFQITDQLSGSLFSVADISGVPSFEVFSDDTVKLGTFGSEAVVVEGDVLKLSQLSNQSSEATAVVINGDGVVGTRELGSNAFNSTTIPTNNNQLTNGAGYITSYTDTNTTYSAGTGLTLTGTTFSLTTPITNNNQLTNGAGYTTNTGTVTSVGVGTGLDVSNATTTPSITLDLSELTDMTTAIDASVDEIIMLDNGAERRKRFAEIFGSNAYNSTTIPTNNNQLTNGAGYITDGNTNWNNSYGFITGVDWPNIGGDQADINIRELTKVVEKTKNVGDITV